MDPEALREKYKDNEEVMELIKELGILSDELIKVVNVVGLAHDGIDGQFVHGPFSPSQMVAITIAWKEADLLPDDAPAEVVEAIAKKYMAVTG